MADPFVVRRATTADIPVVAHHRAAMFVDMGVLSASLAPTLRRATVARLGDMLPHGDYLGWLAHPADAPATIVAGAGVQVRRVLPFPTTLGGGAAVAEGRQAIVLNVYTEPAWRGRGLAGLLMDHVLAWSRAAGIESLVLHASEAGRPMYEGMGFVRTNEMRYAGSPAPAPGPLSTGD